MCQKHTKGGAQNCAAFGRKWVPPRLGVRNYTPQFRRYNVYTPPQKKSQKNVYAFCDIFYISYK